MEGAEQAIEERWFIKLERSREKFVDCAEVHRRVNSKQRHQRQAGIELLLAGAPQTPDRSRQVAAPYREARKRRPFLMVDAEWHEDYCQPNDRPSGEKRQWCTAIVEASDAVPNQRRDYDHQSVAGHDEQRHMPRKACDQDSQTDCIDSVCSSPPK